MPRVHGRVTRAVVLVWVAASLTACGASRSFKRAELLVKQGDLDGAVAYYTKAVQEDPDRADYKMALERTMREASNAHMDKARALEAKGDLENAILEYTKALEYGSTNTLAGQRRADLERQVRERREANRKPARIEAMRESARRQTAAPTLNPASKAPLSFRGFNNVPILDILKFIQDTTGINIIIEQAAQSVVTRAMTLNVEGLTLEQALNLIMTQNQLWYKVMNERTILVIQDSTAKRQQYEEQVIRTFYISHADPQEMFNLLNQLMRISGVAITPFVSVNKTTNTITVRGTPNLVNIIEKVIQSNDRPRAEVIIDVEILEVNRARMKELGLKLANNRVDLFFSPERAPTGATGDDDDDTGGALNLFNLNTITQGISTADFYLGVPAAAVNFLASDTHTRLLAKPQLRGAEGTDLELNLGDEVPVPQTVFGGVAAGGVQTVPIQSFTYRNVGVNVRMNPRVTFENEIVLQVEIENSTLGANLIVAGQALPTFGTRKVKTRMRLREGESNLLAGLVQEVDRKVLTGFPGLMRVPILRDIFGNRSDSVEQTDIVIMLTPRIVRTHELTQDNLNPIYIGSQLNLGLTGPAPVIAAPDEPVPAQPADPAAAPGVQAPVPPAVGPGLLPAATQPQAPATPTSTPGLSPVPPAAATPPPSPEAPLQSAPPETPPAPPGTSPPAATDPTATAAPSTAAPPSSPPATTPAATSTQISVTTPGAVFAVGSGPYTVPISVSGASRLSIVSLSLSYNPAALRVRSVQEGSFLRQGGASVTFTQQADASAGRIDLSMTRGADVIGASGTGLLGAVVFDAVAPGTAQLNISGVATTPDGRTVPLTFTPATVTVK